MTVLRNLAPLALAALLLAACQSDEERAEEFYQSGLAYLEEGEVERAMIEFRNVFQNDGFHRDARATYARLLLESGRVPDAYSQLLRLVEQYPDDLEARQTLAEIAVSRSDWQEAERHGTRAIAIDADTPRSRALSAVLAYREAALGDDPEARRAAVTAARDVLGDLPQSLAARSVLLADALERDETAEALGILNETLQIDPSRVDLQFLKARLLEAGGDRAALGQQLTRMYELFPQNEEVSDALIRWYLSEENFEAAEAFLRQSAGDPADDADGNLTVVAFLRQTQDSEAAIAELDRLVAAAGTGPAADLYRSNRAALRFEAGEQGAAIATLEEILSGAEPSDQTRRIKITLAHMLDQTGNQVGARARIEEVLEEDPSNVDALKMRAARLVDEDRPAEAILDLRRALDQSPRDVEAALLMSQAYLRNGNPDLAEERLAFAVETSGAAAGPSMRYARFLMERNRPNLAQTVLTAIRQPTLESRVMLSEVLLQAGNFTAAQDLANALRTSGDPRAEQAAQAIQSAILLGQNRIDEGLQTLRDAFGSGEDGNIGVVAQILRTLVVSNRLGEARTYLDERIAEDPDNLALRQMSGTLYAVSGELDAAETEYRAILDADPTAETAVLPLQALVRARGRAEEADEIVSAAAEALPNSTVLQILEAGRLERRGDFEGAIGIYETLYDRDSSNVVVANNLASLLTTTRDDAADLERADRISRRLMGLEVPAFRDTVGWIMHLTGDSEAALPELEAAAEGLPEDPAVAFHLGLVYAELGRIEEARAEIERGLDLSGDRTVPQRPEAEQALANF